ncbi:nicotinate-nucleotide--dimethylbenzimidazole phosphoribosyltransferase [Thiohalocapsa marina]|uniref:Nicotinate-nucleotide--dimethylbenzimidazole phosphoribosyltransferase n=1 Tax=Thiohalocapsa marina TaxID=424902 RepID=A0A5M8FSQ9_9GAMM|nr:nicotinate-nucleotide--dimethylbenzimidazole phosphoribosyltransferase [Thiohalocapsa marina]KAA6185642.1 nicotinate-nucleotide--dimethylbenzimidazole phosphoribosyltransferase [Thiohalocapsa marina]
MTASTHWVCTPAAELDAAMGRAAAARQAQLTKPPGALGRLEEVALRLAAMQGRERPSVERVRICVFAADNGVVEEGVSAFPPSVTMQMVMNMAAGGAAISVLALALEADIELVNLGTATPMSPHPAVRDATIAPGSANLARGPAMTDAQCDQALAQGRAAALRAIDAGAELFIGGEMGIGNTTASAAVACALLEQPAAALVGPGTGLDSAGVKHKQRVVARALERHRRAAQATPPDAGRPAPAAVLASLGGFDVAALAGAYVACAQRRLPVLLDGFISSVAALVAVRLCPGAADWMLFSHASAEPGHALVLQALGGVPLLDLEMRLGEGSGAATAVPLLRLACRLHGDMATFAEAGVKGQAPLSAPQ